MPCGRCRECRAGRYNLCPDVVFFATPPVDGAFAEFVPIHEDFAFALPDELSDEEGALMEPLSVGVWACRKAGRQRGRQGARHRRRADRPARDAVRAIAFGATHVTVSDVNPHRLELAAPHRRARETAGPGDDARRRLRRADRVLRAPGRADRRHQGAAPGRHRRARRHGAGRGGHAAAVGHPGPRDLGDRARSATPNTYPTAIALAAHRQGRPEGDHVRPLRARPRRDAALRAGREDPESVKPMVLP